MIHYSTTLQTSKTLQIKDERQRTKDWTGNTRAPGYLVFENKIVENFDSSVQTTSRSIQLQC